MLDVNARRVAERLSRSLGQPVIVDNRPGASGSIGATVAARAKPDGYTIFVGSSNSLCLTPLVFGKLPYDPIRDFAPLTLGTRGSPVLVVNPKVPVHSLAEFVAYARTKPGQLNYGSPGIGSTQHLAMELLRQLTNVELTHVPYKDNNAQIATDLIAGHLDAAVEFAHVVTPHIKAGRIRALAIVGPKRKPILPDVPTSEEGGFRGFEVAGWHGYLVPAGTSPEIVDKLRKEISLTVRSTDYASWAMSFGSEIGGRTSQEFAELIKSELQRWGQIVKDSDVRVE